MFSVGFLLWFADPGNAGNGQIGGDQSPESGV